MTITHIEIRKSMRQRSNTFGFVDVVFDNVLKISGFKVISRDRELKVLWPARYNAREDRFYPIVESVTQTLKDEVESAILERCENYKE